MKTLIKFIILFTLGIAECWAQPSPVQVQEASAAQVAAGLLGAPYYVSPRRLSSSAGNADSLNGVLLSGLATGILKNTTGTGVPSIAASGTDYELPLTFSTGLTRAANTITVNSSQSIATLSNLTTNGFVKTGGGVGTLSVDTNTYLTSSTGVSSITGTPNQVVASGATGAVTLSLPQSIATSSAVQFGTVGISSPISGDTVSTVATDTNEKVYATRTTNNGTGTVSLIHHIFYKTTPTDNTQVMAGLLVDSDDASSLTLGAGHWANDVGCFTRESTSAMQGWGMEAKYINKSTSNDSGQSLWADTQYNMASASGHRAPGITQTFELFNGTPSTPIATGGVVSYHAQTPLEGGDVNQFVGFWGDLGFAIYNAGQIRAYDTLGASGGGYPDGAPGTNYCYINFNNTDGEFGSSSGNLNLKPAGGFTLQNGSGLVPLSNAAGQLLGLAPNNLWTLAASTGTFSGKVTTYNGVVTAGWGVPGIQGAGRVTAQTGANASIATYTVGAADGSFIISGNVLVTTSTTHAFTMTCSYTDEGNTARVITFTFSNVGGTLLTSIANTGGAVPYEGVPLHIRAKASTAITIKTAGTFTSVTYNAEGVIQQIN